MRRGGTPEAPLLEAYQLAEAGDEGLEGAERRRALRVLVNLEVDCESEGNYLLANITDISATGIFVATYDPSPRGTRLNVRFSALAPTGDRVGATPFELEGEVIWVNAIRPGAKDSIQPGMGIRFVDLTEEDQARIESMVRRIAYIEGHE